MTRARVESELAARQYSNNPHNCASNVAYLQVLISKASADFLCDFTLALHRGGGIQIACCVFFGYRKVANRFHTRFPNGATVLIENKLKFTLIDLFRLLRIIIALLLYTYSHANCA